MIGCRKRILISSDKGYDKEEGSEATGNHLLLFPVSRLRIQGFKDF